MAQINFYKVTALPDPCNPDSFYYVKNGTSAVKGYLTDSSGTPYGINNVDAVVNSVNGLTGVVTLDLIWDGAGNLKLTGGATTVNLDLRYFKTTDSLPWTQLTGKPTDIAGYGITDAYTKTQVDNTTGNLANLATVNKSNIVSAINELQGAISDEMQVPLPLDCSANPNYPAATKGQTWKVTVAGKVGGASGKDVETGDLIICQTTNSGGDEATAGSNFFIVETNIDKATEAVFGTGRIATQAEVNTGTEAQAWITPATITNLLTGNYYSKSDIDAKGYLTAEADTLQTVTNRGATTTKSGQFGTGTHAQTTIAGGTVGSVGGLSIDVGTSAGGWANGLVVVGDNSDASKKIGAAFGVDGGIGTATYSFWNFDNSDITTIYGSAKGLRLYGDGSLYYGTPPVNAAAATKFLGLSTDGHTISTRTAAQVLSDIGGIASTTSTVDWNSITGNQGFINTSALNSPDGSSTYTGLYLAASPNQGFVIASRNNDFWARDLNAGTWGSWLKIITAANLAANETDPIWTAAKAAATSISGNWTFTNANGVSVHNKVLVDSAAGNEGLYASPYAYFGMKLGTGSPLIGFNVKPTNGSDSWAPYTTGIGSSIMSLTATGYLQIYTAATGATADTFANFWGSPKTVATTDLLSAYLPLAGGTMTGAINSADNYGIMSSAGSLTMLTRDGTTGYIVLDYNARNTAGTWSQPSAGVQSTAIVANSLGARIYTAAPGTASGSFTAFWGTGSNIATQDWVATQIPSIPTLQQVTTQGGTTNKSISLTNTGIAFTIDGGATGASAMQLTSAGGNGTGGYIQGVADTTTGYGVWTNSNAYFDGTKWVQPRGTSVGSHIYGVTHHKSFTWQYAAPNGTNGATITPTELMSLNPAGTLTIANTAVLTGVTDAATSAIKILTIDSSNTVRYRTPAELVGDIGALSSIPTLDQVTTAGAVTTNSLTIGPVLKLQAAAGTYREIFFGTGSSPRWTVFADNSAESGSNVGSDFTIFRYADGGSTLGAALTIKRATGNSVFGGTVTSSSFITSGGTSSKFVKGDGSLDSNTYLTSESDPTVSAFTKALTSNSAVLTAVKAVDGAGSGLDADLLDGQEGSYYLNYNNLANKPGWINVVNSTDADAAVYGGAGGFLSTTTGAANYPSVNGIGIGVDRGTFVSASAQGSFRIWSSAAGNLGNMLHFKRLDTWDSTNGATWTDWDTFLFAGSILEGTGITKSYNSSTGEVTLNASLAWAETDW